MNFAGSSSLLRYWMPEFPLKLELRPQLEVGRRTPLPDQEGVVALECRLGGRPAGDRAVFDRPVGLQARPAREVLAVEQADESRLIRADRGSRGGRRQKQASRQHIDDASRVEPGPARYVAGSCVFLCQKERASSWSRDAGISIAPGLFRSPGSRARPVPTNRSVSIHRPPLSRLGPPDAATSFSTRWRSPL